MEPLTLAVGIATLDSVDELAAVAARTFPLACPPSTPADNIASFIDTNLSATRFAEYLADPQRADPHCTRRRPDCGLRHADSRHR